MTSTNAIDHASQVKGSKLASMMRVSQSEVLVWCAQGMPFIGGPGMERRRFQLGRVHAWFKVRPQLWAKIAPVVRMQFDTLMKDRPMTSVELHSVNRHRIRQEYVQRLIRLRSAMIVISADAYANALAHCFARNLGLDHTISILNYGTGEDVQLFDLTGHRQAIHEALGDASAWGMDNPIGKALDSLYALDLDAYDDPKYQEPHDTQSPGCAATPGRATDAA